MTGNKIFFFFLGGGGWSLVSVVKSPSLHLVLTNKTQHEPESLEMPQFFMFVKKKVYSWWLNVIVVQLLPIFFLNWSIQVTLYQTTVTLTRSRLRREYELGRIIIWAAKKKKKKDSRGSNHGQCKGENSQAKIQSDISIKQEGHNTDKHTCQWISRYWKLTIMQEVEKHPEEKAHTHTYYSWSGWASSSCHLTL